MIGLPFAIFLTLSISLFFFFQRKPFNFIQNSINYMVVSILTTNVFTILALNLKLMKTTENPYLFPAFILYRDVIIPLLILIVINIFYTKFTLKKKVFYFLFIFACLIGIDKLLIFFNVLEFTKWNFYYNAAVHCSFILIGLGIAKMVLYVSKRSSGHDSHI